MMVEINLSPEGLLSRTDELLAERGSKYGESFQELAAIIQAIKKAMASGKSKFLQLSPDKQEALDLIATKIGRIVYGDSEYDDHWRDIIGYSQLVLDSLRKDDSIRYAGIRGFYD
jgi:deoxycytidylate deaminase